MRILHTADLHFGKKLHNYDLMDQQRLFVDWLENLILEKEITHLLIAGDVFDLANPSSEALSLYYELLKKVYNTGCGLIITAGNHDSPGVLDAPKELLKVMDISITGYAQHDPASCIIQIKDHSGTIEAIVAAVPFLRDSDIRKSYSGEGYSDRILAIKEGIRSYYDTIAAYCVENFPGIPVIASGHLYATGAEISDSERDIQIGNLAGVDNDTFHKAFSYVALGHIHIPQEVGKQGRIYYSGSPYPLSFSEAGQKKSVRIIEISEGNIKSYGIPIPEWRKMKILEGTLQEIREKVESIPVSEQIPTLVEVRIREKIYDSDLLPEAESLIGKINSRPQTQVVHQQISFENQPVFSSNNQAVHVSEISPIEVFKELIDGQDEEKKQELVSAFNLLLEEVYNNTGK